MNPRSDRWIHVKTRLPESQKNVMVVVRIATEDGIKKYRTRAFYLRRYEFLVETDSPDAETARNEQGQRQWFAKGGWYENPLWGEQHHFPPNATVTHWQPFPDFPKKVYGVDDDFYG